MTTVRLYFRNIMLFAHRDDGTDVWFMGSHSPRLFTRETVVPLEGSVIRIFSGQQLLAGRGNLGIDMPRVISFNTLAPEGTVSDPIRNRQLSSDLIARLELPLAGDLRDLPSAHSYGVVIDWHTPIVGGGEHVQRLTEIAVFEVTDVPEPALVIERPGMEPRRVDLTPSEAEPGVADAFFVAGELPKPLQPLTMNAQGLSNVLRIDEFGALHECFDTATRETLKAFDVIPTATDPLDGLGLMSADPYCPGGRMDLRTGA